MIIIYILIIITGVNGNFNNPENIKLYTINGFTSLQSCQKAEFKTKDQNGILSAFCIEKDTK